MAKGSLLTVHARAAAVTVNSLVSVEASVDPMVRQDGDTVMSNLARYLPSRRPAASRPRSRSSNSVETDPPPIDVLDPDRCHDHRRHDGVGDSELVAAEAADHPVRTPANVVHQQGVVALEPADLGLLVMQLDLSPHTTYFHLPVIGRTDHSRRYQVILVDKLRLSELDFVSAGALPPVFSQYPGVEQADDLKRRGRATR